MLVMLGYVSKSAYFVSVFVYSTELKGRMCFLFKFDYVTVRIFCYFYLFYSRELKGRMCVMFKRGYVRIRITFFLYFTVQSQRDVCV